MAKIVTALFENCTDVNTAVQDLVNHGFLHSDISIIAHESLIDGDIRRRDLEVRDDAMSGAATGAGISATIGGAGSLFLGHTSPAVPGVGPVLAVGQLAATLVGAGVSAAAGGLLGALTAIGMFEEKAHCYAEGMRRGGILVIVQTKDDLAERAAAVVSMHHPIDIPKRVEEWRQSGWDGFDPNAEPFVMTHRNQQAYTRTHDKTVEPQVSAAAATPQTREQQPSRTSSTAREFIIPVVEEDIQVGKRQSKRTVKARGTITETPVEEKVRLREEHVTVERRPVNRPVPPGDGEAFKDTTITVIETVEKPVVNKQARIVEEVVVRKEADEHTETVRDTVRRTAVKVSKTGTALREESKSFDAYDAAFRRHYRSTFSKISSAKYEHYVPAYRYGYTIATDKRYMDRDWTAIEPEVRRSWEKRHARTWEHFKDAIRHAWDKVQGKR